jgi:hypothetical protein
MSTGGGVERDLEPDSQNSPSAHIREECRALLELAESESHVRLDFRLLHYYFIVYSLQLLLPMVQTEVSRSDSALVGSISAELNNQLNQYLESPRPDAMPHESAQSQVKSHSEVGSLFEFS